MAANPSPIFYDGMEFSSFREFVNYYGLNYSKAQYYRKRGKPPEEIIELCRFTAASKNDDEKQDSTKRYLCEYQGIKYSSLYEAACTLGLQPSRLYEFRKRNNLTPSAAIEQMMEQQEPAKRKGARAKKCIVDGVEYESREAAMQAYHIPRITVYSRMEREGISFEEALVRGRKSVTYRRPAVSLFSSLHLVPVDEPIRQTVLSELMTSLNYYNCPTQTLRDLVSHGDALLVDHHTYVYYNPDAGGIELISELPFSIDSNTMNLLNAAYVATKVFEEKQMFYLFSFQIAKESSQNVKHLLNAYFSFASIRETMIRNFQKESEVAEKV